MNNESVKKRGWIKNVAIIFLLVLLLLTFFSNTIMTYSLPEVSAQYTQYAQLSSSVKLSGTIKANDSYKVVYEPKVSGDLTQSRKVTAVYVREGDIVEKDQAIIAVEGGMSAELEALQTEYDSLKKDYDLSVIGDNVSYIQSSKALERAQDEYNQAKADYDKLNALYKKTLSGAATDADRAARTEEIKAKKKQLEKRIAELDGKIADVTAKIEENKALIPTTDPNATLVAAECEYKEIESRYSSLKSREAELSAKLESSKKSVEDMRKANTLTIEIKSLEDQNDALRQQIYSMIAEDPENMPDISSQLAEISANEEKITEAKQKLSILAQPMVSDVQLFAAERELEQLESEYATVSKDYNDTVEGYEAAKAKVETMRKSEKASAELAENTKLLDLYTDQRESAQNELESLGDPEDLASQVKAAETSVKSLKSELDILNATTYQSNQTTYIDRNDQKKKLDELSAKISEYKKAPETLGVNAPIAGRVVAVYAVPGESVTSGATVADIEIADKGYTCEVTVSNEEARKISVGSPVTISNSWWYSNIEASITQIRSDVQSQGKKKIVIFEVKGDVYEGQQVTFSVGDKSASYDNVLPKSAIREDNEGKFVLTVESKKTPLGVRYKAKRVAVEITASDDTKAAVSGLLGGEFVITNSTSPIADGQTVRLADN